MNHILVGGCLVPIKEEVNSNFHFCVGLFYRMSVLKFWRRLVFGNEKNWLKNYKAATLSLL